VAVPVVVDARATATAAKEACGVFRAMGAVVVEAVAAVVDAPAAARTRARAAHPAAPIAMQTAT